MVNEIILRAYTDMGLDSISQLADIITNDTDLKVSLVDHSHIEETIFKMHPAILNSERWVSLDRHLANRISCHYYRISRVFNLYGDVIGRIQEGQINHTGSDVHIFDTDMVKGDTIRLACEVFNTSHFTVPLVIQDHQDLIDVEDLMFHDSIFEDNGYRLKHNYLVNELVFTKRTSLPLTLYQPIKEYIYGKFDPNTYW
jgi:hypothetical protein